MSTYTPIASQTLGSAAASVTFSSIPQGYTDLIIITNTGNGSGDKAILVQVGNGSIDTGSNYSTTFMYGNGVSAVSGRQSNQTSMIASRTASGVTGNGSIILQNYSNTTTFKTMLSRGNNTDAMTVAYVGLWRSTSAINIIKLSDESANNFAIGSTFSLYGIQVGTAAQKAQGGNIVTSDGTYVYHTFTSSGAFIPSQALTVDYLVVAGGGGGGAGNAGASNGGGGGGGGYRTSIGGSPFSLTAKSYPVIIGAGGGSSTNGSDSVFSTITSTGGGRGANGNLTALTGGSGGGGARYQNTGAAGNTPSTSPSQGNSGGNGTDDGPSFGGGGGGGAGAAGSNFSNSGNGSGGNGGAGSSNSISGSSVTYAGGGGGAAASPATAGSGGAGGGGAGSITTVGAAGTANTGGGGGGGFNGSNSAGGNGGSGIVIIRYAI